MEEGVFMGNSEPIQPLFILLNNPEPMGKAIIWQSMILRLICARYYYWNWEELNERNFSPDMLEDPKIHEKHTRRQKKKKESQSLNILNISIDGLRVLM
jgi:hypothetical protein